jgi:hypothetical protein
VPARASVGGGAQSTFGGCGLVSRGAGADGSGREAAGGGVVVPGVAGAGLVPGVAGGVRLLGVVPLGVTGGALFGVVPLGVAGTVLFGVVPLGVAGAAFGIGCGGTTGVTGTTSGAGGQGMQAGTTTVPLHPPPQEWLCRPNSPSRPPPHPFDTTTVPLHPLHPLLRWPNAGASPVPVIAVIRTRLYMVGLQHPAGPDPGEGSGVRGRTVRLNRSRRTGSIGRTGELGSPRKTRMAAPITQDR